MVRVSTLAKFGWPQPHYKPYTSILLLLDIVLWTLLIIYDIIGILNV